jgi:PAS domain S-box-containing protein
MPPLRILIVDDHEIVRQGMRSLFALRANWEVCGEAVDGLDAIDKARQLKPDVILLDVSMPRLNGLDAARAIRKEVPSSEIVIVSQHDASHMRQKAIEVGARGYVAKSELSRELLVAIDGILRERTETPVSQQERLSQSSPYASGAAKTASLSGKASDQTPAEDAETRLAAIEENCDDAIMFEDLGGMITSSSAGAQRMFGYSSAEARGKPATIIIPPHLYDEDSRLRQCLRKGERIEHHQTVRVAKSGKRIEVSLTMAPVTDSRGKIVGVCKIARDITGQKQVEHALRESEQAVRSALETANLGTWQWDIATGAVQWSANMERIHGRPAGSFRGTFEDFCQDIHPEDRATVREAIQRSLAGEGKYHCQYRQLRPDGTYARLEARGRVIYDQEGRPARMTGTCTDVTEREMSKEALLQTQEELERRVKKRTAELESAQEMLRALSRRLLQTQDEERRRIARELHDTAGQILAALSMNLVPLEQELSGLYPELAKPVSESVALVDELSRDLRTISHLLHPPLLDEAGLCSAIRWYVEGFAERSKIEVGLELPPDMERMAPESETAIFRIVQECLTNVHRHSGSPTAEVRITHENQEIRVEIRDEGKGIPAVRADSGEGIRPGVGIQGMQERVRQLGGKFEISSGESGTSIVAVLPTKAALQAPVIQAV